MPNKELIQHMLTSLEHPYKRLTAWELSFLESVTDSFYLRGTLSDEQVEKLEAIYTEKTA